MSRHANKVHRVVYLIGAGATQAEVDHQGGEPVNLLMGDDERLGPGVGSRIIERADEYRTLDNVRVPDVSPDIEKLISLLDNTKLERHKSAARELRDLYFQEILLGLSKTGVLEKPELAILLLQMHKDDTFAAQAEELAGIINLNHDWLFQIASEKVYAGVNPGFQFDSTKFTFRSDAPLLLKPHGSFNWIGGSPIRIDALEPSAKLNGDMLWIPPTILKESKEYPFNKLAGMAFELLSTDCDILRIVGCRLSQNDWNIISLLFNAQYYQAAHGGAPFRIDLIMSPKAGGALRKEYSYLQNVFSIEQLSDGDFTPYQGQERGGELNNPFKYWLRTKIGFHEKRSELHLGPRKPAWL